MRKLTRFIPFILLIMALAGCGSANTTTKAKVAKDDIKYMSSADAKEFTDETDMILSMYQNVYNEDRRSFTSDELAMIAKYEQDYGKNNNLDQVGKLIVYETLHLQDAAIRDSSIAGNDSFSDDVKSIKSMYGAIATK